MNAHRADNSNSWKYWAEPLNPDILETLKTRWPKAKLWIEDFRVTRITRVRTSSRYFPEVSNYSRDRPGGYECNYNVLMHHRWTLHSLKVKVNDSIYTGYARLKDVLLSSPNLKVFWSEPLLLPNDHPPDTDRPEPFRVQFSRQEGGEVFPPLEEIVLRSFEFGNAFQCGIWDWSAIRTLHLRDVYALRLLEATVNLPDIFKELRDLKFEGACFPEDSTTESLWFQTFLEFLGKLPKLRALKLEGLGSDGADGVLNKHIIKRAVRAAGADVEALELDLS